MFEKNILIVWAGLVLVQIYVARSKFVTKKAKEALVQPATRTRTIKPPFPKSVVTLLETTKLAYLSTATASEHSPDILQPHLSLMNFTYCKKRQQLIMTTRLATKKAENLQTNRNVAILIHDFPTIKSASSEREDDFGRTYSITLTGVATILDVGSEESEVLRDLHADNNPLSATFIRGEGIAVVVVDVQEARICDVADKVTTWKAGDTASM